MTRRRPRSLIGVKEVASIAHRPLGGGVLHGHTYEITAWFEGGQDAIPLKAALRAVVGELDHREMPDELSRAEDMGAWIGARLPGCKVVDVNRPLEGFYACVML